MKTILKTGTFIMIYWLSMVSLCAADSIQNVHSTSHQLNGYDTDTQIAMSWDAYTGANNYFYAFNTTANYTITDFDSTTSLTSIQSEDFKSIVEQSANSSVAFYFHIATKTGNFMGWTWTSTTHRGPYYIDIKPPSNVSVSGPETTSTQSVTLSLYADDNPTQMNISNTDFGEGTWVTYATSTLWNLKDEYGTQTVYVLFRDALGNTTDESVDAKITINYIANSAPEIKEFLVGEAKIITGAVLPDSYTPVGPQVLFDLYDKEGGDIQLIVTSSNIAASTLAFTRTIAYPYTNTKVTIPSTVDNGTTTYTITNLTADMAQSFSLIIMPATYTSVSSTITLMVKDSGGLTDSVNIVFNVTDNLLVKLSNFTVTPNYDHNLIQWQTESEIDTEGFTLKRSETKDGVYLPINGLFISSTGSSISGASYSYQDTQIEIGKTYYYQLIEIDSNNNAKVCTVSSGIKRSRETVDDINYDANGDGEVNVGDVIYLLKQLTNFQESK